VGIIFILKIKGTAHGMSMHESQSLFWERHVGKSKCFWENQLSEIKKIFGISDDVSIDEFYNGINMIKKGLIRVESDELTYPLHVIIRYEIEKGFFDDSLDIDNLPNIWNEKMKKYLGIEPKDLSTGCLQDIHWVNYLSSY
jgi:carboxypeptidase Taq